MFTTDEQSFKTAILGTGRSVARQTARRAHSIKLGVIGEMSLVNESRVKGGAYSEYEVK